MTPQEQTNQSVARIQEEEQPVSKRLGRKMNVGDLFESTSKWMGKYRYGNCLVISEKVYRRGDKDYFTKDNRRYFCEVKAISETRTRYIHWRDLGKDYEAPVKFVYLRRWKFTYVVKILEN